MTGLILPAPKELVWIAGERIPRELRRWQQLPRLTIDAWLEDVLKEPTSTTITVEPKREPIPRRLRSPITQPGWNKGVPNRNKGRTYEANHLTRLEALRLLDVQGKGKVGIRNRAMVALMWRTGLRVFEACAIKPHHVDYADKRVLVLRGKGRKKAWCAIDHYGLLELQPWLMLRSTLGIPADSPLFCTVCKPDPGNQLNTAYIREVFRVYGKRAGIEKRCHPHILRHTLACEMIQEGFSLLEVQAQLRHSSPATTAAYIRSLGADEAFDKVAARRSPLEVLDV